MARRNNRLADVINLSNESFKVHKTLGDATNEYMQNIYRRALSDDTLKHEQEGMRSVYKLLPADTPLNLINRSLIEIRVLDPMRESGLKANTVNGRIKTLSRVLEHAVELGYISTNPARQVPLMKLTASQIQTLNNEQIAAILAQIDSLTFTGLRDKTLIKLMLDTGIRIREAMDLTVDRVDLRERKLRAIKGKNRKEEDIPISIPMCKELKRYMNFRDHAEVDNLFITIDGHKMNRRTFQLRLQQYGRQAGIKNVRVSPHTLRHTFAKNWIIGGGDVFSLQKILRHSTMEMVRIYVNLWSNEVQQQHDRFSPLVRFEKELTTKKT